MSQTSASPLKTYLPKHPAKVFAIDSWRLCVHSNSLSSGDQRVELEHRLVALLLMFIDHPGEVLEKERILATIWQGKVVNDDSLAVAISHLRKALGDNPRSPRYIKTIPGVGYQFIASAAPVEEAPATPAPVPEAAPLNPVIAERGYPHRRFPRSPGLWIPILLACLVLLTAWYARDEKKPVSSPDELLVLAGTQLASGQAEGWRQAIGSFRQVLKLQPRTAAAYLGIAQAKMWLLGEQLAQPAHCDEVIGLLDKAIQIDSSLVDAWRERGNAYFWCRRDTLTAEANYQRAMALAPEGDTAPMQLAQLRLAQGRFEESLALMDLARQHNPLNYSVPMVVWIYQMNRRQDLAWAELQRITRAEPDDRYYHVSAQRVLASMGREEESFAHWQWLMADAGFDDDKLQAVQAAFAEAGLSGVNRWLLETRDTADLGQYLPPLSWARYALAAGETTQALEFLEQAAALPQVPLLWIAVDPAYSTLSDEPRFRTLVTRLQKPVQTN
ncbi:winged helix-turn-helix domain-containing protein [Cellvibrio japonicus]|uniref:Putative Transcriptional regulator CadC n=1 Tax=Cellvibrio japonicus (strain Ueda107) TaxID=498211 RepID=B3PJR7_CELJU|nr:transcriptional regulator [Cellvibrio japonicus]ACE85910.1 putative Transcriptional regulator CadC [Cellvibrio japonicus Ueda107]QEI12704.1 transcriptional regulator [Cellvibrio japonicus]QEI16278.1 transcriptional regulator [Cellvibrio japonicus]QEI19856.1 transcriptional regulator [Cellvibrio japonicus]